MHYSFANELVRLYTIITQRDGLVRQLQDRCVCEAAAREPSEQECKEMDARAEKDLRKMSQHVPRMLMENYEMCRRQEHLGLALLVRGEFAAAGENRRGAGG